MCLATWLLCREMQSHISDDLKKKNTYHHDKQQYHLKRVYQTKLSRASKQSLTTRVNKWTRLKETVSKQQHQQQNNEENNNNSKSRLIFKSKMYALLAHRQNARTDLPTTVYFKILSQSPSAQADKKRSQINWRQQKEECRVAVSWIIYINEQTYKPKIP